MTYELLNYLCGTTMLIMPVYSAILEKLPRAEELIYKAHIHGNKQIYFCFIFVTNVVLTFLKLT